MNPKVLRFDLFVSKPFSYSFRPFITTIDTIQNRVGGFVLETKKELVEQEFANHEILWRTTEEYFNPQPS